MEVREHHFIGTTLNIGTRMINGGGGVIGSSEGSESGQIDSKRNHENFYSHSTFQYSRARRRPLHRSQNAILISDKQHQGACPPHRTSGGVFRVMQRECFGQSRIPTRRCLRANAANYRSQDDHVFDGQGARGRVQRSLHPAVGWLGVCQQGGGLTCTTVHTHMHRDPSWLLLYQWCTLLLWWVGCSLLRLCHRPH